MRTSKRPSGIGAARRWLEHATGIHDPRFSEVLSDKGRPRIVETVDLALRLVVHISYRRLETAETQTGGQEA